ncbi:hypothetical protein BD410DRAFT_894780 [Rickenella mellea]|uniref:Uncharacterized protein n=1 Tax=Rickenella mellea TaxID=50990 RepID=A0A4Y7QGQ0_9AGAM|nr:hypothetical protein BD410DRAFT_894780 [Rickenella mellea]
MVSTPLKSTTRYIRLSIIPGRDFDELWLRKKLQDSLTRSFGTSYALTYLDILSLQHIAGEDRKDAVIRVAESEAGIIMAAAATATGEPRLSVVDDAPFLPALITA